MKIFKLAVSIFLLVSLLAACKKEIDSTPTRGPKPPLPDGITTREMKISLPPEVNIDPATCNIFSQSFYAKRIDSGGFKVPYTAGKPNVAWVFDKDENAILAGFVTDSSNTISVATTAEVLLYIGTGATYQPNEVMAKFINGIGSVPGVAEWKTELEGIFKSDPLMLKKGLFIEPLKTRVTAFINSGVIKRKPADITVDANDIRSGLQLADSGLNNFIIKNSIRRRAQAFVYKMSYTDMQDKTVTVNNTISGSLTALSSTRLPQPGGIRDFKGVLQDWASGKGIDFFTVTSPQIEIPLEDNEKSAKFKVRVIGPGKPVSIPMTSDERGRWWNLSVQTALLDYLLPAFTDVVGHKDLAKKMNDKLDIGDNQKSLVKLIEKTSDLIAAIPAASDAIEAGDFDKVIPDVFYAIVNSSMGNAADEWIKALYESVADYVEANVSDFYKDPSFIEDRLENLMAILGIVDMGLKAVDYARITKAILQSNTIEEWDLLAREVQINISPVEFSVGTGGEQKLTAHIKTDLGAGNPVIEYQWETSGKYGHLKDDRGHEGTSFSSSLDNVSYLATATYPGSGEHKDTIKVTVYLKQGQTKSKIGEAKSVGTLTNKEVVVVNVATHVNVAPSRVDMNGNQLYKASNPTWDASITPRPGAKSYTMRVIKNGEKLSPVTKTPSPSDTIWRYPGGNIGTANGTDCSRSGMFAKIDLNAAQAAEERTRQEALIACWIGLGITAVEFTIEY